MGLRPRVRPLRPRSRRSSRPTYSSDPAPEDLTAAQRRKIFAIRTKLIDAGIFSEEQFKAQMNMSYGVDSVSGLTKDQASDLIERLLKAEEQLV